MAVLKANGSFLKANGKILKAVGGGGVIYELNINSFDVATLNDRGAQFANESGYQPFTVSKDSDYLLLQGTDSHNHFYLPLDQFNIPNTFAVEITFDELPFLNFMYINSVSGVQLGSGNYWANLGWYYKATDIEEIDIYHGYASDGWDIWYRYAGMPYSLPFTLKNVFNVNERIVETYYNDILIARIKYNANFFNEGVHFYNDAYYGLFKVKNIKIYPISAIDIDYNKNFTLPTGYTKVSAINSNGGWFNTGYVPRSTDKIETRIKAAINGIGSYQALFGTRGLVDNSNEWTVFLRFNNQYTLSPRHRASNVENTLLSFDYGVDRILVFDGPNLQVLNDSGEVITNYTDNNPQGDCINPLYMFGTNWNGNLYDTGINTVCYYLRIRNSIGNIVLNLIPCKRDSDGAIGMYDVVSDTFFTNSAFTIYSPIIG